MVEIIPKTEKPSNPFKNLGFSFYLGIFFLIICLIFYFLLNSFLARAQQEISQLETELKELKSEENLTLEKEVLVSVGKLNNFLTVFDNHPISSKTFQILEKNTHPDIWFFEFESDSLNKNITILGNSRNFLSLGQQIFIFEQDPLIKKVELKETSINRQGYVEFVLNLIFETEVFKPVFEDRAEEVIEQELDGAFELLKPVLEDQETEEFQDIEVFQEEVLEEVTIEEDE